MDAQAKTHEYLERIASQNEEILDVLKQNSSQSQEIVNILRLMQQTMSQYFEVVSFD